MLHACGRGSRRMLALGGLVVVVVVVVVVFLVKLVYPCGHGT